MAIPGPKELTRPGVSGGRKASGEQANTWTLGVRILGVSVGRDSLVKLVYRTQRTEPCLLAVVCQ